MAVVTFGGAYAVLAYVAQQAVDHYGWVTAGEMLDGLGMAESTPGPLIMVTQFVGFLGAWRDPEGLASAAGRRRWAACSPPGSPSRPASSGSSSARPYVEALRANKALSGALAAITAAVVGVILNLAVWFGSAGAVRRAAAGQPARRHRRHAGAGLGQHRRRGAGGGLCRCCIPLPLRDDPGPAGQFDGRHRLRIDAIGKP